MIRKLSYQVFFSIDWGKCNRKSCVTLIDYRVSIKKEIIHRGNQYEKSK